MVVGAGRRARAVSLGYGDHDFKLSAKPKASFLMESAAAAGINLTTFHSSFSLFLQFHPLVHQT